MQVHRSEPPVSVERPVKIEFTRDEVLAILHKFAKQKMGFHPLRVENLEVRGDDEGNLTSVEISCVEIIPLSWNKDKKEEDEKTEDVAKTD